MCMSEKVCISMYVLMCIYIFVSRKAITSHGLWFNAGNLCSVRFWIRIYSTHIQVDDKNDLTSKLEVSQSKHKENWGFVILEFGITVGVCMVNVEVC